jgi:glycosyltransferase involved in cell wall biosynthesis
MIFIPAYKTEKTVCSVIERIPKDVMKKTTEIVVMDNHSPDRTYDAVKGYKKKNKMSKLKVFRHSKNIFFGGNLKSGLDYAIKHKMDIMVMLHSDAQYPSEKINALIKPIEEGKAETVFGSRFLENPLKGGMPIWRYLGNIFLTMIENVLIGKRFSEWHSGFTAYDCHTLKKIPFNLCESGYEITTDILLLFISAKSRIAEIPIPTHYGEESTSPSIKRTFLYFINSFKLAILFFLHRIGIIKIQKYSNATIQKRQV